MYRYKTSCWSKMKRIYFLLNIFFFTKVYGEGQCESRQGFNAQTQVLGDIIQAQKCNDIDQKNKCTQKNIDADDIRKGITKYFEMTEKPETIKKMQDNWDLFVNTNPQISKFYKYDEYSKREKKRQFQ